MKGLALHCLLFSLLSCGRACEEPPRDIQCSPDIGAVQPIARCTSDDPCTRLLATYVGKGQIDTPGEEPSCEGSGRNGRPVFDDGAPRRWRDADGTRRYWCEYRPAGTSVDLPRPLLIYIHGSGGDASTVYQSTMLRRKAPRHALCDDAAAAGFILVSTQGRFLHWPTESTQDGSKHDTYHRDLDAPSGNRDIALVDHIVDSLVAEGVADPRRIYLMGWSNGARFAALYGIARHETPSPGGNRVAAVANYSGGDTFENIRFGYKPSCQQQPYPRSAIPLMMVSRSCDAVACDEEQEQAFLDGGTATTPGNVAAPWIAALKDTIGSSEVQWRIIDDDAQTVNACEESCGLLRALNNHMRWPDGVDDNSGIDHELDMLSFLRAHPLMD